MTIPVQFKSRRDQVQKTVDVRVLGLLPSAAESTYFIPDPSGHGGRRWRLIGRLFAMEVLSMPDCAAEVAELTSRGYDPDSLWVVTQAYLEPFAHGEGIGRRMYEAAFDEIQRHFADDAFVGPYFCRIGSGTSFQAKRVWDSLARRYPSAGRVLYLGQSAHSPSAPEPLKRRLLELGP